MPDLILTACVVLAAALVIAAAVTDIASLTIPNRIPLGLLALFAVASLTGSLGIADLGWHVATGGAVFAVTVALFAAGLFGGGDAKLLPAVAIWLGPAAVAPFIFYTAIAGGVLALAVLALRRLPVPAGVAGQPVVARLRQRDSGIPYGVAIAAGFLMAASKAPLFAATLV
jgi:prepilin peptidase CpaA